MSVRRSRAIGAAAQRRVALLLGLFVSALALSVLAGWALDIPALRSALSVGIAAKANAAIGFLLCGMALAVLSIERIARWGRTVATVAAAAAAGLGALTLSQDLVGGNFGIDQWLFRDTTGAARAAIPGRMSPPTSFSLALAGTALVLASLDIPARFRRPMVSALGSVVVLIGGEALLAHLLEPLIEFRFLGYARIATSSALAFVVLGSGLLSLMHSEGGLGWSLDAATTSGFLVGVAAMIATAGVSYQFTSRLQADAAHVTHSEQVLKEIHELSAWLGEFTISAGRYIITRDERTLDGREATKAAVLTDFGELRALFADRPDQRDRLGQIERIHAQRVAMSDEIIANFRRQVASAAKPASGEGSPLGQEYPALGQTIERLIKAMEAAEYAVLDLRQAQSDATSAKTFLLLPLGAFLGMTILALALFFLNDHAAARAQVQARLAQKRERLNLLHDIDRAIIAGNDSTRIAEAVLPRLRDLLGLPRVAVNMFDLAKGEVEWLAAVGRRRLHVGTGVRYSMALVGDRDGLARGEIQLIDVDALGQRPEAEALLASGVHWYMVVPMIVGSDLIGGLSFGGPTREFSPAQIEMAQEVAAQLAIAIAQLRLAESARRADAQYRQVFENVPVGIVITAVDGSLRSVNPACAHALGYASPEQAMASLGGYVQGIYSDSGAREEYMRILQRDGVVTKFETTFVRNDASPIRVVLSGRAVQDLHGVESLFVSMFDDITLQKAQEQRIARLSHVKEMQSSIKSAVVRIRERQALLDELCRIAVEQGGLRAAWVAWHDVPAHLLRPVASAGHLDGYLETIRPSTEGPEDAAAEIAVGVLRNGVSVVTRDTRTLVTGVHRLEALDRGYAAAMHLPLSIGGVVEGVLVLFAAEVGFFDDEERHLLDELAADVSFALESLQKSERLDYLAFYDLLTGLPNRRLFHDRLSHSLHARVGPTRLTAVVLLDVERFRHVNESHGQHAGDELLREIGTRLQQAHESAARIGVDVFGLVLRGARTVAEVNRALEGIVTACFTDSFVIDGGKMRVACRAGVSVHPNDGKDADALLRNAEAALRLSKSTHDRTVFYAPEMNARVAEALAFENKLRVAIERREFVLHYQPKVDMGTGRITGLEALIRWRDPDEGLVSPARFIPVLEDTGMIVEVGRWVVERALADLEAWAGRGIKVPRVAVNVSSIQLHRKEFVDSMIEEIRRGGDSPEWLELEITESLVMRDVLDTTRKLSILRGMGVTVAIDDFGTGYSSLSYLSRLPVDSLKIDGSFVSGMTSGGEAISIVSTIIALAHGLRLKVVAEGVETREQGDLLRRLGCDEAQGFLFSRPLPADEIEALLRADVALPPVAPGPTADGLGE